MSVEVTLFIVSVAVLFATAISILVTTLVTGSPPMPSGPALRRAILAAVVSEQPGAGMFYELGSGWGGLAIALAKAHPDRSVIGLERSFIPWAFSVLRVRLGGPGNVTIRRADIAAADLSDAAVAVCYLTGETLRAVAPKLEQRLPADCCVVSAGFAWPGGKPAVTAKASDAFKSLVYVYRGVGDGGS